MDLSVPLAARRGSCSSASDSGSGDLNWTTGSSFEVELFGLFRAFRSIIRVYVELAIRLCNNAYSYTSCLRSLDHSSP